jgi:hypothetical protein
MAYNYTAQIVVEISPKVVNTITFNASIVVQIAPPLPAINVVAPVVVSITPIATPEATTRLVYPFNITTLPININISDPLISVASRFVNDAILNYIDEDRELKTLLNYGEDRQSVVLAYRSGAREKSIQLKLLQPVPDDVNLNDSVFLSREVVKSLIDTVKIRFAPPIDNTPFLRPKNTKIPFNPNLGKRLKNITLQRLSLNSGSIGTTDNYNNISFEDQIFRQWYTDDFNSADINIDFTDYNNFIFYSSAALRLVAFREKLKRIEKIETQRTQFISSSFTGSISSAGSIYVQEQTAELAKEKESIIRAFDKYEQYLYFTLSGSNSPYTASFDYVDGGVEYNSLGYWPKSGSALWPVTSSTALTWFDTQFEIAQRYDEFNQNNLVNTIPTHIREDENSQAYITFVSMIGHFFDTIKPYIDKFGDINSRALNPDEELAKDLINEVAESYGFKLPTLDSVYDLSSTVLGTGNNDSRRLYTAQTYKRLLHNLSLFAKSKGTRSSLNTLLRSFGLPPEFISVREVGTATTSSYKIFDEFSTGLDFDSTTTSYVKIPFSASLREPKAIQFNILLPTSQVNTILTGDDSWGLHTLPHPTITEQGRLMLLSGSTATILTDYYPIFTNDLINITVQNIAGAVSLQLMSTEGDTMIFKSPQITSTAPLNSVWNNTQYLYLGGSGSAVQARMDGTVDEFRMWGKTLSQGTIETNAYDPGSNAGDEYSDPSDYLYAQLSFNRIDNSLLTGSAPNYIINESPYAQLTDSPSIEQFETYNINTGSFNRYSRIVRQIAPTVGSQTYVTNKIRIAPEPVFNAENLTTGGVKKLSRSTSIVSVEKKRLQATRNEILLALSPTDFVNQNIIRNLGAENINNILGLPVDFYRTGNPTISTLQEYYSQFYYAPININKFIRILSGISSVLDQTLNYFIPSKATLFKGILIEPNILERTTIPLTKNLRVYGAGTRKTLNAASSLTGSKPDYAATFNLSQQIDLEQERTVLGSSTSYKTDIDISNDLLSMSGKPSNFKTEIEFLQETEVNAKYADYRTSLSQSAENRLTAQYNSYQSAISKSSDISIESSIASQNGKLLATVPSTPIQVLQSTALTTVTSSLKTTLPNLVAETSADLQKISGSLEQPLTIESNANNTIKGYVTNSIVQQIPYATVNYYTSSVINRYDDFRFIGESATYRLMNEVDSDVTGSYKGSPGYAWNRPKPQTIINLENDIGNKIKYNDINYGSEGAEPYRRVYTRKLFKQEIEINRTGGVTSLYIPALREIKPIADLTDVGTRTYFNNPEGVYLFAKTEKLPVYPKPINFEAATTWSYGQTYNIYDVVYQDVSLYDQNLESVASTAQGGNGRYYVFNTRAAYAAPSDGTSYYLGGTPSYLPPSLDRNNWQLLKFKPTEVREPRKIVYDIFRVSQPELNNYRTTTVSVDRIVDIPDRYVDTIRVASIGSGSYAIGEAVLQNTLVLFALQSNTSDIRVRFYSTDEARTNDINRSITTLPTGSHGVLLDTVLPNVSQLTLTNPIPLVVAGEFPPNATIYYTINNLTGTDKLGTTIYAFYFALEIEPRIPFGYLPKHYRFYRDTSTATKRRNYEGCKNTVDTTIDGLPPVQVFIGEGNELVVSPTQTNTEIQTGGGGTLQVQ